MLPFPAGSADLIGKLRGNLDQPGACRYERPGQHTVEPFHAHLAKEADFREMCQAVGVVRVGFVRRHIKRSLSVAGIDADRWHALGSGRMIEPH